MKKLALTLNEAVNQAAAERPIEHADVCVAAFGVVTAYLERIESDERRRALAECLSEMLLESARPRQRIQRRPVRARTGTD